MHTVKIRKVLIEIRLENDSDPNWKKSDQLSNVMIVRIVIKLSEKVEKCGLSP